MANPAVPPATPAPTAKPKSLTFKGTLRAYQFDRENVAPTNSQSATNFLAGIHSDFAFGTGFSLGASYYGAYAFGLNGRNPQVQGAAGLVDNTLPAATLSAFPETYLQYTSPRLKATVGNQLLDEKWAPASDSRVKPVASQGIEASYNVAPDLTVSAARVIRFEGRTASAFTRDTLLTSSVLGAPALPARPERPTSGFLLANIKYEAPAVSILLENYSFYDIASLQYGEANVKLFESTHNPFVALQYVGDNQTGSAVVGRVANHTYGAELGADVVKNVKPTIAYDGSPTGLTALTAPRPFGAAVVGTRAAFGSIASPYSTVTRRTRSSRQAS